MNRNLVLAAALFALAAPVASHAQTDSTPAATTARAARSPEQVVNLYSARLSLTEDQKAKLKPIIADRQQQMLELRSDTASKPRDKVKKMKTVMEDSDKRIKAILTPDQQTKYDALEAEQKEKMKERRQARGGNS